MAEIGFKLFSELLIFFVFPFVLFMVVITVIQKYFGR